MKVRGWFAKLQSVPDVGLAILDEHMRFRMVNSVLAQMNGIPVSQHLGKPINVVLGDFSDKVAPLIRQVLANGRPLLNRTLAGKLPTRRETGYWVGHCLPLGHSLVGVVVFEITNQCKVESFLASVTGSRGLASEADRTLAAVEREHIIKVLKKVHGKVSGKDGAAARLGLKRTTLQSRLYKLGINPRDYKSAS